MPALVVAVMAASVVTKNIGALALIMAAAMAVTPFLNNTATVLMPDPIAGSLAQRLGMRPDAFLMAAALGAARDFLTPSAASATRW